MTIVGFEGLSEGIATADKYTRWIVDRFRPFIGKRIIEVGVGHGNYLSLFGQPTAYLGVDIDQQVVESARAQHAGLDFVVADVCSDAFVDAGSLIRADTVICLNMLQLVEDDKRGILNMVSVLEPGGHLCLLVPGVRMAFGRIDRLAGNLRRYSRKSLRAALPPNGCEAVFVDYFNPVGLVGWWVNNLFPHRSLRGKGMEFQVAAFDKYAVPISRAIDPLSRRMFGQSVVMVVKKT